ncbi:MAG: hypothetical protein ABI353_00450 [Isosphaeraceae bacterium]
MMLTLLILFASCGQATREGAETDPAFLVKALSSDQAAERLEAAGVLEERGRPALPALHAAKGGADPDLKERIALLIDLIERQRLMRATKVRLDAHDTPLPEAVESIRTQTGFDVVLEPKDAPAFQTRRITLKADGPVPFWDALDRLGAAGGVRYNPGVLFAINRRAPLISLILDDGPAVPVSYAGPFRVNLIGLSRHRDLVPARKPAKSTVSEEFSALLQVFAEPGLILSGNGPLVLGEASDDQRQDLRSKMAASPSIQSHRSAWANPGRLGVLQYQVPLTLPANPGHRLERFKGYAPVTVVAQTSDPVVVRLNGTEVVSAAEDGVTLTARPIQGKDNGMFIHITVTGEILEDEPPLPPEALHARLGRFQPPYRLEDHLLILDANGLVCQWSAPGPMQRTPDGGRFVEIAVRDPQANPPVELRYHGVVGAATEVPFEFQDLPMP